MYELDLYMELQKDFPDMLLELETPNGIAYPKKKEVLKKIVWYGFSKTDNANLVPVSVQRIKEIIMQNKKGIKVDLLENMPTETPVVEPKFESFENSFDILKKNKSAQANKKFKKHRPNPSRHQTKPEN